MSINTSALVELLWLINDELQAEQVAAEQLQQVQTREAISLLRARGGVSMRDL